MKYLTKKAMKPCLFCVFLCILLAGCSTRFAYNYLDWVAGWYVKGYVSLTSDQKKQFKASVDEFHLWHRQTQLPNYAEYTEGLKERLASKNVDGAMIHAETDKVQLLVDESIKKVLPELTRLVSSFSDEQVEEVLKNFEKKRNKYKKKYVDASKEKLIKYRTKEMKGYTKRVFGKLTKEQQGWLKEWAHALEPSEALTLKQHDIWLEDLKTAMAVRNDPIELELHLRALMFYRTDNWDQELQDVLDKNQETTYAFIAKLINNSTDKQRKHMNGKLDKYATDFVELSQEFQKLGLSE